MSKLSYGNLHRKPNSEPPRSKVQLHQAPATKRPTQRPSPPIREASCGDRDNADEFGGATSDKRWLSLCCQRRRRHVNCHHPCRHYHMATCPENRIASHHHPTMNCINHRPQSAQCNDRARRSQGAMSLSKSTPASSLRDIGISSLMQLDSAGVSYGFHKHETPPTPCDFSLSAVHEICIHEIAHERLLLEHTPRTPKTQVSLESVAKRQDANKTFMLARCTKCVDVHACKMIIS